MEPLSVLVTGVLRGVLRLALLVFTVSLIISLIFVAIVATVFTVLWALLTGRKPAAYTTFTRFRQSAQQFRPGSWASGGGSGFSNAPKGDVVDVQVTEVPNAPLGNSAEPTEKS
jgi:uncharacterized membrane protein YgcG